MPIVRTHRAHFAGLGQQAYGPGAVCFGPTDPNTGVEQPISCLDPNCTYGDCGSTMPQLQGPQCLGPTVNGVESQIACTDPMCTYGDCITVPRPPGSGGNPNLPEGGLPQGTTPNVTTVMQVTPRGSPTVSSTPSGMPPGGQPGTYPQPNWFTGSTYFGTTAIPNWLFIVGGLGVALIASRRG